MGGAERAAPAGSLSAAALGSVVCPHGLPYHRCPDFSQTSPLQPLLQPPPRGCSRAWCRHAPQLTLNAQPRPTPARCPDRKEVRPHLRILPLAHPHPGGEAVLSSPALSLPKVLQTFRLLPLQTVRAGGHLHLLPTQRALGVLQQTSVESDMSDVSDDHTIRLRSFPSISSLLRV